MKSRFGCAYFVDRPRSLSLLSSFLTVAGLLFSLTQPLQAIGQSSDEICSKAYTQFFQNDEIKMSFFFGYVDEGTTTYDRSMEADFLSRLEAPCAEGQNFCGFTADLSVDGAYSKKMIGPDGQEKNISLRVERSSVSDQKAKTSEQVEKSKRIEKDFLQALQAPDDAVFYIGHARYGTGPGFEPIMSTTGWVLNGVTRTSLRTMVQTLKVAKSQPKIIAMLGCSTEDYYGRILHKAAPHSALLLTRQVSTITDIVATAAATADSLLGFRCQEEFNDALFRSTSTFTYTPWRKPKTFGDAAPHFVGFFNPVSEKFRISHRLQLHLLDVSHEKFVSSSSIPTPTDLVVYPKP